MKSALAGVVVGQMMLEGVVKGGTAMKLRLGEDRSRFTPDFDVARRETFDEFRLRSGRGWLRSGRGSPDGWLPPAPCRSRAGYPGTTSRKPST